MTERYVDSPVAHGICIADGCTQDAVVGLGPMWFCMEHFDAALYRATED